MNTREKYYNEDGQKIRPDELIVPWRIDIHCPLSDGSGLRFEYDGEEGEGMLPSISFYVLHPTDGPGCNHALAKMKHSTEEEDKGWCSEYVGQTENLISLAETFLDLAKFCQRTANRIPHLRQD
jgi:hypothetical protein